MKLEKQGLRPRHLTETRRPRRLREYSASLATAEYEGGGNDDDLTGWVQTERMINMTPEEILEEEERQREAGMNTPLETIVRSKVRPSREAASVLSTNENERNIKTRHSVVFRRSKVLSTSQKLLSYSIPNGSVSSDLEKRLREAYLEAANHHLNIYEELFLSYVDETFKAVSEENDYADTLRMSLSEKYAEVISIIVSEAMITVRSHAERFFVETFMMPVRKHTK